jgi:two-component system cell cycle response regulator
MVARCYHFDHLLGVGAMLADADGHSTGAHHGQILIVDDSPVVRALVGGFLRNAGYTVEEADNGVDALSRLEKHAFDVVITDLRMPEMDGFGLLEAVKRKGAGPEVILLTGTHAQDMSSAIRALRLGAHDFLTKPPAGPDEVIVAVDRAVEKKRLREANARLLRELEALSRTDPLTSALNRGAFEEALRREAHRARRYQFPLSLVMLDLDFFKPINDTHGHRVGDGVLQQFVARAGTVFRESDAIHRYGGEEFAVLLPHTAFDGALDAARRMVQVTSGSPFVVGRIQVDVTVSAGVATAGPEDRDGIDLVTRADAALYEAKRQGRNRAVGAPSEG